MNPIAKIEKPIVKRSGRIVNECQFFGVTGECFGGRCYWSRNGICKLASYKAS